MSAQSKEEKAHSDGRVGHRGRGLRRPPPHFNCCEEEGGGCGREQAEEVVCADEGEGGLLLAGHDVPVAEDGVRRGEGVLNVLRRDGDDHFGPP